MRAYLGWMLLGLATPMALFVAILMLLYSRGALPPPQFSNSICVDQKLRWMRNRQPRDVDLLVLGSSVAWRHFNGVAAVAAYPKLHPLNAGFCGTKLNQTEQVADWLTKIILGAALTQLHWLWTNAPAINDFFANATGMISFKPLGTILAMASAICGFLLGYVAALLFLPLALTEATVREATARETAARETAARDAAARRGPPGA